MGENVEFKEQDNTASRLREQIRHTESDITETVHSLEQRLSPSYLRQRGARKAKRLAWEGTARLLEVAQHTSVQASLVGASALWMLIRTRRADKIPAKKPSMSGRHLAGTATKAVEASALWKLMRKSEARRETPAKKHPVSAAVSGLALAATAAKGFLSGARTSQKSGTSRPGRKVGWRSLATAIGAALGSYWYSHKGRRV